MSVFSIRDQNVALELWKLTVATIAGGAIGVLVAGVLWPWLGHYLLQPCPMFTTAGVWTYAGWCAFSGLVNMLQRLARS